VTAEKPTQTLQDVLDSVPNLVDHLYSNRKGSVLKDAVLRQPTEFVAPEFTTWRDEQLAWRQGIAFYDQSFHMTTTYLRGPDAQRLLSSLAVNSFETFGVGRSRHFVCCSPDGHVIGDVNQGSVAQRAGFAAAGVVVVQRRHRDAAKEIGLAEPPDRGRRHEAQQRGREIGEHRRARDRKDAGVGDAR
jgi:hypothetical protein